ncbi:hypothetical protein B0H15DRAFT_269691 [Mycena belliarum]|uniref:Protein kinase domain-containing protein n=1 Tax=Mycena belliarum TaxID=1033014 RepID=A0AAD6XPJ5_9AGAR|nr:hypothetical protein B0H15DRAFT_269691 [Mycena belliae]
MTNQRSPASMLTALRQSGVRNPDGTELKSLRPRKRARPDPYANDFGPWGTLPETFDGLLEHLVPAISEDRSQSKSTAPYSASYLSPLSLEFSYLEDDLPTDLSRIYQRLIKGKRHGRFSATSRQLWDTMAVQGGLRGLTSTTGYHVSLQTSTLVVPMMTIPPISPPLCMSCSREHPPLTPRRGEAPPAFVLGVARLLQDFLRNIRQLSSSTATPKISPETMFSATPGMKLFLQMYELERELNHRDLNTVSIDSEQQLFTRQFDAVEVEEASTRLDIQVNYGIIYTGHKCVLAKRAQGIGRDGTVIEGLALSQIHVVAGPGATLPLLAMLIAAHAEVEDDLPRRPSAERWAVLLKMVETERERFTKERLGLLAEMEQHRNSRPPGQGSDNNSEKPDEGGNNTTAGGGAWGAVQVHAQAYYLVRSDARPKLELMQTLQHLHFGYPGSSAPPRMLFKIPPDALEAHLAPSPPPSRLGSSFSDHTPLPKSAIAWAEDIIIHTPHLHIRQQLPSGNIAQVFRADISTEGRLTRSVVLKLYGAHHLADLLREVSAYDRLRRRLTNVPDVLGIYCSLQDQGWVGLLMDDEGVRIGSGSWAAIVLTAADRHCLFNALLQLHAAGVVHNDFFPRNVLRRPDGTFSVIDFGNATVGHDCPGSACPELAKLYIELQI